MRLSLHPKAADDLQDAIDFYRHAAGMAVAGRLRDTFESLCSTLLRHPGLGTPQHRGRRAHPLRGFPYLLVHRLDGLGIRVLAFRHQRRSPGYGNARQ